MTVHLERKSPITPHRRTALCGEEKLPLYFTPSENEVTCRRCKTLMTGRYTARSTVKRVRLKKPLS